MAGAALPLLLAVAVGVAGCAGAEERGSHEPSRRPSISVGSIPPVVVQGAGFEPRERVVVVVRATGWDRTQVVASSNGAFTVRFASLDPGACAGLSITAVGNRGSRAEYRHSRGLCPRP